MEPVSDQCCRTDLAPDADPVDRHRLVADEADHPGCEHPADVGDLARVEEPPERLVAGDGGGEGDHGDDEDPCQVLGPAVPVGVPPGRQPAADQEGDPERDGGEGVGEVVDRVGEQRHRSADGDDRHLEQRRGGEREQ